MEDRSAVIKLLLFLTFPLRPSSAVTHTLEYSYTMVKQGSRFTSVALLDGEEFMYYDSNTANMTPNTEWIKKVESDSSYWEKETRSVKFQRDWLIDKLNQIKVTEGVNTLQRVYGCEIDVNGVTRGYDKSIYNGKDFISLDLDAVTWTAVDERAKNFTEKWNPANNNPAYWKNFLNRTCVDRLKRYILHRTKKEPGGGETAITVVVVLLLVLVAAAAVVGFVIYKKKLCAYLRSGYVAARQSAEQ